MRVAKFRLRVVVDDARLGLSRAHSAMIVAHVLELESAIRGGSELSWRPNEILSKLDVARRI